MTQVNPVVQNPNFLRELSFKTPPGETCTFEMFWDERKGKSSAINVVGNGDGQPSKGGGKGGGKGGFGGGYGGGYGGGW